jgi:hypothetical protein
MGLEGAHTKRSLRQFCCIEVERCVRFVLKGDGNGSHVA